jgi:hypothetical protein
MVGALAAVLALAVLAAVAIWERAPLVVLAALVGLQLAVVVLLLDTRHNLSVRLYATSRKLERLITHRGAQSAQGGGVPVAAAAAVGPAKTAAAGSDVRLVLASRIFDLEWYEAQAGLTFDDLEDAVRHYLDIGDRTGASPHPLFSPTWVRQAGRNPLVEYLRNGEKRWGAPTSPVFDPALLDASLPVGRYGPLASFLLHRGDDDPLPYGGGAADRLTLRDVRALLLESLDGWRDRDNDVAPARGSMDPPEPDETLREALMQFDATAGERPLVSVILPTWNRASTTATAVASVQAQSYERWELLIADDGSTDDTALVLESLAERDDRVRVLSLPHAGVSAARNAALRAAQGEYVAFLDSDKEWEPEFLRTMVAWLTSTGKRTAAAVCAVSRTGRTFYRSVPATDRSIRVGNTIDQTAIVASRELVEQVGGFDETLRRAVDYDLVLSLFELEPIEIVPFVGVRYSEDDQDPNRISESESVAWNFWVSDRQRWTTLSARQRVSGLLSVVVDDVRSHAQAQALLENLDAHSGGLSVEILLVPRDNAWPLARDLALLAPQDPRVSLVPVHHDASRTLNVNRALRAARGDRVLVMSAVQRLASGDLATLVDPLEDPDVAATHPVTLDATRLVRDAGVVYPEHGTDPVPFLDGLPSDGLGLDGTPVAVPGAPLPLAARTADILAVRGMSTRLLGLWADVDLSQRLAQHTGGSVRLVTDAQAESAEDTRFGRARAAAADVRTFAELWPDPPAGSRAVWTAAGRAPHFTGLASMSVPSEPERWSRGLWLPGADRTTVHERPPRLRWSVKTAAPADDRARSWGDFHFAGSLARALRALGQDAVVDYQPNAERPTGSLDDVVVNLRGLRSIGLPADATSIAWVISHPDDVTAKELAAYDLRYAASTTWSAWMTEQFGVGVTPLLQCTDPELFYPDDSPVPEVTGKILMVGNSRKQYRPAAWHASRSGLPMAIYGGDWEGLVPDETIAGQYVPNDDLRRYYRSAAWVLNDHWADMRASGYVSNRIFDVLASGGRLLTDDVAGLADVFPRTAALPEGLAVFESPVELVHLLEKGAAGYYTEEGLAATSELVRRDHSFAARAEVMLDDVLRHRKSRMRESD